MKLTVRLIPFILGRLIFLAGTVFVICLVGGGSSFLKELVGLTYLILWVIWWTLTFIGRRSGETTKYDRSQQWLVILVSALSVPFLIVVPAWEYAHFLGPIPRNGLLAWSGLFIFASGIILQVVAMRQLRSNYTVRLGIRPEQVLVTTGLYHRIRHPGYLSYLVSILGIGLAMSSIATLILVIFIFIFLHFRMNSEEKMLLDAFGDQYSRYRVTTKRLIPFIY